MVAHGPNDDEESKEGNYMHDEEYAFCEWQHAGQEDVEGDSGDEESHNQESGLPELREVGVGVLQVDQALNKHGGELSGTWASSDPAKCTRPSYHVAEGLFVSSGREFRNPMVLSASCGCH